MPRNVRNFWIKADIDGRATSLEGGPVRKDGGFCLTIKMRDDGNIITPLIVQGTIDRNGVLTLMIGDEESPGKVIKQTRR